MCVCVCVYVCVCVFVCIRTYGKGRRKNVCGRKGRSYFVSFCNDCRKVRDCIFAHTHRTRSRTSLQHFLSLFLHNVTTFFLSPSNILSHKSSHMIILIISIYSFYLFIYYPLFHFLLRMTERRVI